MAGVTNVESTLIHQALLLVHQALPALWYIKPCCFRSLETRTIKEVQESCQAALATNQERLTTRKIGCTSLSEREYHPHYWTASDSILISLEFKLFNCTLDTLIPKRRLCL